MVGSGDDPNKRLAMYWNDGDMTAQPPGTTKIEYAFPCVEEQLQDESSLLNYCKKLNHLKLQNPAIALGENEFVYSDGDVCIMKRTWNGQECWVLVNFSAKMAQSGSSRLLGDWAERPWTLAGTLDVGEEMSRAEILSDEVRFELAPYGMIFLAR